MVDASVPNGSDDPVPDDAPRSRQREDVGLEQRSLAALRDQNVLSQWNYIRALDIGCGFGYVSGVLLRDTALSCYCGIDKGEHRISAAREMLATNGLTHTSNHFETRNLFRIDADFMRRQRPTLIILCEVLEHLTNPLEPLSTVVHPAPDDASILFSVPLAGRLENVKGHKSFFDVDRLNYLCR